MIRSGSTLAALALGAVGCTEPNPCFAPPLAAGCPGADAGSTSVGSSSTGPLASSSESGTTDPATTGVDVPELVAWYRFEEDPADVGGVVDSSGNGFDGQCAQTCPGSTDGVQGRALFNDELGFVTVAAGDVLELQALTISVWIRDETSSGDTSTNMIVGKPYLSDGNNSYRLLTRDFDEDGGRDVVFRIDGETTRDQVLVASIDDARGEWVHVAATWDGEMMALHVGGVETGRIAAPIIAYDAQPLVIGADLNAFESDNWWEGGIDELELFSRVLTQAEIEERAG